MVKCKNCKHLEAGFFVGLNGDGVYSFSWCGLDIGIRRMVDGETSRRCLSFNSKPIPGPWWKGIVDKYCGG